MSTSGPVISQPAFLGTVITFFALALLLALLRTIIRIYKWRRIFVDDYFFFLAVVCHIISTALVFDQVSNIYAYAALLSKSSSLPADFVELMLRQGATKNQNVMWACQALIWGTIFSVKFSFLFYFRSLVWQVTNLRVLWWSLLFFMLPATSVALSAIWIICPYTGEDILSNCSVQCVVTPNFLKREETVLGCTVTLDVLTDIFLICIPIRLLQQTRFKVQEKVKVGIVLCISIVIIAISLFRAISFGVYGTLDQVWDQFWIQIEASMSVIVVCMTVFRTLFVTPNAVNNNIPRTGRSRRKYVCPRRTESSRFLPDIETGDTVTEMRSVIQKDGPATSGSLEEPELSAKDSAREGAVNSA